MSAAYILRLDHSVRLFVDFVTRGREVTGYSVTLTMTNDGGVRTIRVYDSAHGFNEMHRYTRTGGKQPGETFHRGTLGEGLRAVIAECKSGYRQMIEGWDR